MDPIDQQQDKRQELVWKVFLGFQTFLLGVALLIVKSLWELSYDLSSRITIIESSRCTAHTCATIRYDMVSLQKQYSGVPEENKKELIILEQRIRDLEKVQWSYDKNVEKRGAPAPPIN